MSGLQVVWLVAMLFNAAILIWPYRDIKTYERVITVVIMLSCAFALGWTLPPPKP